MQMSNFYLAICSCLSLPVCPIVNLMIIGERIRTRRAALGWTQKKLAEQAGISPSFLSELETGERSVGAENLMGIARALGVSLDFLMKGEPGAGTTEPVQIPRALSDFAKEAGLSFAQTLVLLEMRSQIKAYRRDDGGDNLEAFDWRRFYEAVKPFMK